MLRTPRRFSGIVDNILLTFEVVVPGKCERVLLRLEL